MMCDTLQQYRLANETLRLTLQVETQLSDTLQQYRLANETNKLKVPYHVVERHFTTISLS